MKQSFSQTLKECMEGYTNNKIQRAKQAQYFYNVLGDPSYTEFMANIQSGFIYNCPVTEKDVKLARKIFGEK